MHSLFRQSIVGHIVLDVLIASLLTPGCQKFGNMPVLNQPVYVYWVHMPRPGKLHAGSAIIHLRKGPIEFSRIVVLWVPFQGSHHMCMCCVQLSKQAYISKYRDEASIHTQRHLPLPWSRYKTTRRSRLGTCVLARENDKQSCICCWGDGYDGLTHLLYSNAFCISYRVISKWFLVWGKIGSTVFHLSGKEQQPRAITTSRCREWPTSRPFDIGSPYELIGHPKKTLTQSKRPR